MMQFELKAVPEVVTNDETHEFFLGISKEELLLQHKNDCNQFCITISYALTMLCSPHGFSHNMGDVEILKLLDFVQSDEAATGLAFVVEYRNKKPYLITGLEY